MDPSGAIVLAGTVVVSVKVWLRLFCVATVPLDSVVASCAMFSAGWVLPGCSVVTSYGGLRVEISVAWVLLASVVISVIAPLRRLLPIHVVTSISIVAVVKPDMGVVDSVVGVSLASAEVKPIEGLVVSFFRVVYAAPVSVEPRLLVVVSGVLPISVVVSEKAWLVRVVVSVAATFVVVSPKSWTEEVVSAARVLPAPVELSM